jgi:hypothetical protein
VILSIIGRHVAVIIAVGGIGIAASGKSRDQDNSEGLCVVAVMAATFTRSYRSCSRPAAMRSHSDLSIASVAQAATPPLAISTEGFWPQVVIRGSSFVVPDRRY